MKHVDMTPADFGKALKIGKYAWPGGYPTFFLTSDGETMCHDCARKNGKWITDAIRTNSGCGWRVVAIDVNWEDHDMICCHCNEQIESAYAGV